MIERAPWYLRAPRAFGRSTRVALALAVTCLCAGVAGASAATVRSVFVPATFAAASTDSLGHERDEADSFIVIPPGWAEPRNLTPLEDEGDDADTGTWLRAPFGENLLTDPEAWRGQYGASRISPVFDYNRVDRIRAGVHFQAQAPESPWPRFGGRFEYAFGRDRALYGVQLEQPLASRGRLAIGATIVRATDHSELHQVDDVENTLAMLFGRQDYRDYFEREGFGAYLSSRVRGFSTVSVTLGNHEFRSLPAIEDTPSWFHQDRDLRANPPIDEGESHTLALRLERVAHRTRLMRAGLYHWIELERAGGGLGGDFDYSRLLADVRSVLRLSPAATLSVRIVGGSGMSGALPAQREFTAGGVDGLRAHKFSEFRGNQLALAQAEYTIGLWRLRTSVFEGGLHAIAFVDAGRAWENAGHAWNPNEQRMAADGGLGLGTSEDNLRVYFAKNLRDPDSKLVISARLQRPF